MSSHNDMARPRNPNRKATAVNVDAEAYDALRRVLGPRSAQDTVSQLARMFAAMPDDAREILLSRVSKPNQIRVLQAVLRELRRK